jgi:hypothetical protein
MIKTHECVGLRGELAVPGPVVRPVGQPTYKQGLGADRIVECLSAKPPLELNF